MFRWFTNKRLNEALKRVAKFHVESSRNNPIQSVDKRLRFLEAMTKILKMHIEEIENKRKRKANTQNVPEHLKKVWKEREKRAKLPL